MQMYQLQQKNGACKIQAWALLLLLALGNVACVGTIEDTELKQTKTVPTSLAPLKFDGISAATAIASDKVEVYFFPASGDPANMAYEINYDGISTPIAVLGDTLRANYQGLLRFMVTGLGTNQTYNFEVQVKNVKTGQRSNSTKQETATTFGNITANFLGIQNVQTMPGLAGMNSVKVSWSEAEKQGSVFVPKEIDATNYEVTLINGDILNPGSMNDNGFSDPLRKVVLIAPENIQAVVGGLLSDTLYHVQVRAIHHGFTLYGADLNYQREENTKYLSLKTLSADLTDLQFDEESFTVALSPGASGLQSIQTSWVPANGAFDHYRVYYTSDVGVNLSLYSPDNICDGAEVNDPNVFCKQVDFDKFSATIVDMSINTLYNTMLAVCQSIYCEPAKRQTSTIRTITTTPSLAVYSGILEIKPARSLVKLDHLNLIANAPEIGTGVIDGIIIEYKHPTLGDKPLNHPVTGNSWPDLYVENFNFQSATEYEVGGVDPYTSTPYCFSAIPFTYELGVVVEHRTVEVIQCAVPAIEAPGLDEFPGVQTCSAADVNLNVTWIAPTEGVYSHFEVIILPDGNGVFDFAAAIAGNAAYQRILVGPNLEEFTINAPGSGGYSVGVLTYVNIDGTAGPLRSSFDNNRVTSCSIP
jgi:hypothetical protein